MPDHTRIATNRATAHAAFGLPCRTRRAPPARGGQPDNYRTTAHRWSMCLRTRPGPRQRLDRRLDDVSLRSPHPRNTCDEGTRSHQLVSDLPDQSNNCRRCILPEI